jgi:hypothetical protein
MIDIFADLRGAGGGAMGSFFGDGSDGDLNPATVLLSGVTAPNGGTTSNLFDLNSGTVFTTGILSSASDQVVLQVDFGVPQFISNLMTGFKLWRCSLSVGTRSFTCQYSDDGSTWTDRTTSTLSTTVQEFNGGGHTSPHRYWRFILKAGGSNCTLTAQGLSINWISSDLQTTLVWRILYPVTDQTGIAIKQFTSLTLPVGYEMMTDNPCRGLIIYSHGDVGVSGKIDMSQKAGIGGDNIAPLLITKETSTGTPTIDKYYLLTNVLQTLRGGSGGSGGFGGGYAGATGRQSTTGSGGSGRINAGGFGGGGSGGGSSGFSKAGGIGGNIDYAELGGGKVTYFRSTSCLAFANASNGGGGIGVSSGTSGTVWGGKCNGGGGGGSGSCDNTATPNGGDGQYAGGFVCIISGGNVTINSGGLIKADGGNGGNGGNGAGTGSCGGGGGGGGSGGGVVAIYYKVTYTNSGSISVNGGIGGIGGLQITSGESGGAGTSGSVGTIFTQQVV